MRGELGNPAHKGGIYGVGICCVLPVKRLQTITTLITNQA